MVPVSNLPQQFVNIGQGYTFGIPNQVYIMFFMVILMAFILNKTKFGRYALAMGGNREATRLSGINTKLIRWGVYAVMGVYVAVAAVMLTARSASAQVSAGQHTEMDAIAAVVVGGTPMSGGSANVVGTLFGCLIVGVINNGLNLMGCLLYTSFFLSPPAPPRAPADLKAIVAQRGCFHKFFREIPAIFRFSSLFASSFLARRAQKSRGGLIGRRGFYCCLLYTS